MEQTLEQFKSSLKNKKGCLSKIRNSWGVYDYYKYYRKTKPSDSKYVLTESQYFAIIRRVNKLLADDFVKRGELELPYRMGKVILQSIPVKTTIRNGKVVTTKRIDWDKTLNLWYSDSEAYSKRTLIYSDGKDKICTRYIKKDAIFKNKQYYEFELNRELYIRAKQAATEGTLGIRAILANSEIGNIKGLYDD